MIQPGLPELKITRQNADSQYSELMNVMKNHIRSSDYMVQYFKKSLVGPCDCKACQLGLWEPLRMPESVYSELATSMKMPLPIPDLASLTADVELPLDSKFEDRMTYLPLTKAMLLPFTDEHQPSKMARAAKLRKRAQAPLESGGPPAASVARRGRGRGGRGRGRSLETTPPSRRAEGDFLTSAVQVMGKRQGFPIATVQRLRGIVYCKEPDCMKPRCIFGLKAPSNMLPAEPYTTEEKTACQ